MKNTPLKLVLFGDELLQQKAKAVRKVTEYHRQMLDAMLELMRELSGIGLAAQQVGLAEALIVVANGDSVYKLINPKIIKKQGSQSMEEGCLSVPGVGIKVCRAKKVWVKALDEFGAPVEIVAENLVATAFQHELDHLAGKLIVDYASFLEKIRIKDALEKIKKRAHKAL